MDEELEELLPLLAASVAAAALVAVEGAYGGRLRATPVLVSSLSGEQYLLELLGSANPDSMRRPIKLTPDQFRALLSRLCAAGLADDRFVPARVKLAEFLYFVCNGVGNRAVQDRFQHSADQVSRAIKEVAGLLVQMAPQHVRLNFEHRPQHPSPSMAMLRYFPGCIGAIDGTHTRIAISDSKPQFVNYKGYKSINNLVICDFDMRFTFYLAGWEGAGHDQGILNAAYEDGLRVPEGRFLLGDSGFTSSDHVMVPYPDKIYHLKAFRDAGRTEPGDKEELFNLRHSSLRSVIERSFGVLKKKFAFFDDTRSYYAPDLTRDIFIACLVLHNMLRDLRLDLEDDLTTDEKQDLELARQVARHAEEDFAHRMTQHISDAELRAAAAAAEAAAGAASAGAAPGRPKKRKKPLPVCETLRDAIADLMWEDHQRRRVHRHVT